MAPVDARSHRQPDHERRPAAGRRLVPDPTLVRLRPGPPRSTARGPCRRCRASGRDRRGRSGRTPSSRRTRRCPARGRRPAARRRRHPSAPTTSIGVPAGVWTRTLASRLPITWRRRSSSPATLTPVSIEAVIVRAGSSARGIGDGVVGDPRQVDGVVANRPPLVEPREQEQVVDERAHPPALGADPGHRRGQLVGVGRGRRPGTGRRSPGPRSAASAARATRRRRTGAAVPRSPPSPRAPPAARRSSSRSGRASRRRPCRAVRPRCRRGARRPGGSGRRPRSTRPFGRCARAAAGRGGRRTRRRRGARRARSSRSAAACGSGPRPRRRRRPAARRSRA